MPCQITLIPTAAGRASADQLRERLRSCGTIAIKDAAQIDTSQSDALGVVVVVLNGSAVDKSIIRLLEELDEACVPVLVLAERLPVTGAVSCSGAMVASLYETDAVLTARIEVMQNRQAQVDRLRQELNVATRLSGGMRTEITSMHDELQLAAMIQREFLPDEMPSLHGLDFACMWRPASYVSGDIYDCVRLDEDHVGVFLADAVGHGVPAALLTMVIRHALRTKEIDGGSYRIVPPSEALHRLNQTMIRRQSTTTRFATAVYGVIDCRSRVLTLAGAGHPPPLCMRASGEVDPLETDGGLLGVFEDEQYEQIEVELGVGDSLVIYSDGFEQAFPAKDPDPHQRRLPTLRYLDEFRSLAEQAGPAEMVAEIRQRLNDQTGSLHQADDLTLICATAGSIESRQATPAGVAESIQSRADRSCDR